MVVANVTRLGFEMPSSALRRRIYIPKYYDPEVADRVQALRSSRNLVKLGDLVADGHLLVSGGDDIGKIHYGTGPVPFVRTSDIATWEVTQAPKQSVSEVTHEAYVAKQDVAPGDLLFVRNGLYLIGNVAMVTTWDLPLLIQSHLLRLRCHPDSPVPAGLLLASLSTPVVRRQVRSMQFTAGIIDKLEDRFFELEVPVPASGEACLAIDKRVKEIVLRRVELREHLRRLPYLVEGRIQNLDQDVGRDGDSFDDEEYHLGFQHSSRNIVRNVVVPRYYDPSVPQLLDQMSDRFKPLTVRQLVDNGLLSVSTGVEVGKMAYGTGDVPFVRTADLSTWELRGEPKQRVSDDVYNAFASKTDVSTGDVLLVRDGTYLVGTSALVNTGDGRMLFAGGLYKLRSLDHTSLDPFLLLTLLNMPILGRQVRAKKFTRDIIDTLGHRLMELFLPFPRDQRFSERIAAMAKEILDERHRLRDEARQIVADLEDAGSEELSEVAAAVG